MRHSFYIAIIIAQRRVRFAGHCFRATDQVFSNVVCWKLPCPNRERRPTNYMDTIESDTRQDIEELSNQISSKDTWRGVVNSISVAPDE